MEVPGERFSILDALAAAGHLTEFGDRTNVLLIRENDGKAEYHYIDLTKSDVMSTPVLLSSAKRRSDGVAYPTRESSRATTPIIPTYRMQVVSTIVSAIGNHRVVNNRACNQIKQGYRNIPAFQSLVIIFPFKTDESHRPRQNEFIDFSGIIKYCVSKWYVFVIGVVVCVALTMFHSYRTAPEYLVKANLLIAQGEDAGARPGCYRRDFRVECQR